MQDLSQARKLLEASLDEEHKRKYYDVLKQWMSYASPLTKQQFNKKVRELLQTPEQLQNHNKFLYSYLCNAYVINSERNVQDKCTTGLFEVADSLQYTSVTNSSLMPNDIEHRSAAAELFIPDSVFLRNKIALYAWDNELEGSDECVTEILMQACLSFIQNIVTAMVSRKMSYKIRNRNFQHSFGVPIPDPFLRNTNYIIDNSQKCKTEVSNDDDSFIPAFRPTLETTQDQAMFSLACSNQILQSSDKTLTMELLFHTLREDPNVVGIHSIHSLHLLKCFLALEDA